MNEATEVTLGERTGAGTWPQLASDARNTSYNPGATGPQTDGDVAWTTLSGQPIYRPVVTDSVYLTDRWGSGMAVAVDDTDGYERWTNRSLPPVRWAPAYHEGFVFVLTRTESNDVQLRALAEETGDEEWGQEVTASSSASIGWGPTVDGDRLYIGSNTGVLALETETGDRVWNADLDDHVTDRKDERAWRTDWPTPAVTDKRVYTFDANDRSAKSRYVYALDRETGEQEWTTKIDLPERWSLEWYVVAGDDHIFISARLPHETEDVTEDEHGVGEQRLYVVDEAEGGVEWVWELDGMMVGPPSYAEGILFIGEWIPEDDTGNLHAVQVADKSIAWTYSTDVGGIGTPAVTPNIVYITQGRELAAVGVADGSLAWRLPFDTHLSTPVVANNTVYVLTGGDPLPKPYGNHGSQVVSIHS